MKITKTTGFFLFLLGMLSGFGAAMLLYAMLADRLMPPISGAIILPETGLLLPIFKTGVLILTVGLICGLLLIKGGPGSEEGRASWPLQWRLSIRTLMIVVAVLALLLGLDIWLQRRAERFKLLSNQHLQAGGRLERQLRATIEADVVGHRASWHNVLSNKYERAAARPWEPVAPDPPEP